MAIDKERLNLHLPKDLLDDLRRIIPARERTRFVEEVLARELRRRKLLETISASAGAWSDADHPELDTPDKIERWIAEGRASYGRGWDEE